MSTLLWVVVPYLSLATFVVGHFWRYTYDQFGWTTRSSQLYESRLLRWGSPLFHVGILGVVAGHVIGLLIPKRWTEAAAISQETYHLLAVVGGGIAGLAALVGLVILVYRRRTVGPVFSATTRMDKLMYVLLGGTILLGMWNTFASSVFGHYDYRQGVSLWFRGIFTANPDPALMTAAPFGFQVHALLACGLFALWPFTRLVHVFSAPVGYLTRPYIVYRSRDERPGTGVGSRAPARGWENAAR